MKTLTFACEVFGEAAQLAFGAQLGQVLGTRSGVLYLHGDLGTGKTTLVRGLLRARGCQTAVRSPTYTLIEPYDDLEPPIAHLDLYRLGDPEELDYLGLRDLLERHCLVIVEWPERGRGVLPAANLEIELEHADAARRLWLRSTADWASALEALSAVTVPGIVWRRAAGKDGGRNAAGDG
jgi:tRNA threonylcarbamoyladenosine biosynthesis protein TsaE